MFKAKIILLKGLFIWLLFGSISVSSAASNNLTIGIFPYLSAAKLLKLHSPVIKRLNSTQKQPFMMVSAPSFGDFIERTKAGEYDLVITAPHMGRLAEMQSGYQRVVMSGNESYSVFVVHKDSPYNTLADIKGGSLTLPPKKAIISIMALNTMKQAGLKEAEVKLNYTKSHNNALLSVVRGESTVAAFGYPTWKRYPARNKENLRVLAISEKIPGFLVMANSRVGTDMLKKITASLVGFESTDEGRAYFLATALERFIAVDDATMMKLTGYVKQIFKVTE